MAPSTDDLPGKKPPERKPRGGGGRKPGKQPGSAGAYLAWNDRPDETADVFPEGACSCPHLERLSDACERRRVPLTVMFRHLREDTGHLLGGGTAAFMRLGHHAEAEQAASYIGRQHKFVLSC